MITQLDNNNLYGQIDANVDKQCHFLNYRMQQLDQKEGLRSITLRRNLLKDSFGDKLVEFLRRDKYIKTVDIAGCHLSEYILQKIIKLGLVLNKTGLIAGGKRINNLAFALRCLAQVALNHIFTDLECRRTELNRVGVDVVVAVFAHRDQLGDI